MKEMLAPLVNAMFASLLNALAMMLCRHRASSITEGYTTTSKCGNMSAKMAPCSDASGDEDCKSTDASGSEQNFESSSDSSDGDDEDLIPKSEPSSDESDTDWQPAVMPQVRELAFQRRKFTRLRTRRSAAGVMPCRKLPVDMESSPPIRGSISAVINALNGWMVSNSSEDSPHGEQCTTHSDAAEVQCQPIDVLQQALAGLDGRDVAMMRVLLDAKLASET